MGRGTDKQFQVIGSPYTKYGPYTFTPVDKPGAINPPLEGEPCYGLDLTNIAIPKDGLMLDYFFDFFNRSSNKSKFFLANNGIDRLAGTDHSGCNCWRAYHPPNSQKLATRPGCLQGKTNEISAISGLKEQKYQSVKKELKGE